MFLGSASLSRDIQGGEGQCLRQDGRLRRSNEDCKGGHTQLNIQTSLMENLLTAQVRAQKGEDEVAELDAKALYNKTRLSKDE